MSQTVKAPENAGIQNEPTNTDAKGVFVEGLTRNYRELLTHARSLLRRESTWTQQIDLEPAELVDEALLQILRPDGKVPLIEDTTHALLVFRLMMRRILIDRARVRGAQKRGRGEVEVSLSDIDLASPATSADILVLNEALERLSIVDPRLAETVELLYFGGYTVDEAAQIMGRSPKTIKRDQRVARSWLAEQIIPKKS